MFKWIYTQVLQSLSRFSGPCREEIREDFARRVISEVRSLLGMANYSAKYIPNFATVTAPLRNLTKKNTPFTWTDTHQNAFRQLTNALASAPCMAYFDKQKETLVTVDASPVGVSAILSQKNERNGRWKDSSVTEKEALAIIYGVEHLYLYGHEFVPITDHNPLEIIYGSRKSKPSARIERWVLRLCTLKCCTSQELRILQTIYRDIQHLVTSNKQWPKNM